MKKLFIIVFIGLFVLIFGLFFIKWLYNGENFKWVSKHELESFASISEPLMTELQDTISEITYSYKTSNFFSVVGNSLKVVVLYIILPFRVAGGFINWLGS